MSEFWWAMLIWMIYIPLLFLWGFTLFDLFMRKDLGWVGKGLWAIGIVFLPLIGMLVYVIARPKNVDTLPGSSSSWDSYMPGPNPRPMTPYPAYAEPSSSVPASMAAAPAGASVGGGNAAPAANPADMERITQLHDSGTISDEEYERLKRQAAA